MFVETENIRGEECKGNAMLQQIDAYGGLPTFVEGVCDKRNSHCSVTMNGPISKLS